MSIALTFIRPLPPGHVESPVQLRAVDGSAWDRFASAFQDVTHEQTDVFGLPGWAENKERLVGLHNGAAIGGALVKLADFPLLRSGVAVIRWGPIWRPSGRPVEEGRLALLLEALKQEYAIRRGYNLVILPRPEPDLPYAVEAALRRASFISRPHRDPRPQYFVNTDQPPEALITKLSQKWRYNLKQARRTEFEFEFVQDLSAYETFMRLYNEMIERKRFYDTSPIGTLKSLMQAEVEALRPHILIVRFRGNPVASAVLAINGDRAVYLYGATSSAALSLNAGYAMHWHVAEALCRDPAIRWYDLGGAPPGSRLRQFKQGFVGTTGAVVEVSPPFHFGASPVARFVGQTGFMLHNYKASFLNHVHKLLSWRNS